MSRPAVQRTLRVLPSRERVAELLRGRVRDQGVALALGLIDLRSFEERLLRAAGFEAIGVTEARLALAAVAPAAARGTRLAELAGEPGFAESFLELWDTLRRAGVDTRRFAELARRLSRRPDNLSGRRFTALARIAEAYEGALARRGVVDGVGARVRLPRAIADLGPLRLRSLVDGADVLEVEVGPELPIVRARLWEALARRGLRVRVSVPELGALPPAGPDASAGLAASAGAELATALEQLRRNLVEEAPSVELVPRLLDAELGGLARVGLLPFVGAERARALVDPAMRTRLRLIDAGDERAELRAVCARIRELLQRGVPPHRITLAVPRLGLARARVLAACDAAELPVEESRGQPVIQAAPLRLSLALIEAAERDLPREALAAVLESAYVARRDPPVLLAALREAGSRDDRGIGHLGRLRAHAARLQREPHPEADKRKRKAARDFQLADRWERLFERLRLPREASVREHLDAVFAALRALGIARRCLALPALGEGSRERRLERDAVAALARDRAALEALEAAGHGLDDAATAVGIGRQKISLTDFRAHLEAALAGVRQRPPGIRGAGIQLRDLGELAGSPSDYLFILHAVEGELPGPGRPVPFLDDDDRSALDRAAGRPVLGSAHSAGVDAGSFALACAGVGERLVISAHHQDASGREVVPSRWFRAIAAALGELATREGPSLRRYEAGVIASLAECSTRGQVLTRLAQAQVEVEAEALADAPGPRRARLLGHALASRPELGRAVDWTRDRASDLARRQVELPPAAVAEAHARLGFSWTGEAESPGLVWRGSASSLEDYAACPFRFFAARVLRLRPRPSTRDDLSAAEQGSVRHEVLAEVMEALRAEGLAPLEGGDQTWRENQLAHEVCDRVLDRWQQFERTGPLPLWQLHRDLVHRDLGRVLEGERRAAIEAWEPGEFEIGFGVADLEQPGEIEGLPLAIPDRRGERRLEIVGRVDRIDYRGDGRELEGLIIDYKSGRVGDRLRYDQLARTQLQLPLYAAWLAARRPELNYTDAAYVSLRDGERSQASLLDLSLSSVELDGLLELEPRARAELRARAAAERDDPEAEAPGPPAAAVGALDLPEFGQRNLADNLWALLGGVAEGRYDVRPFDPGRACRFCPYGPVCRIERGDELEGGEA